MAKKNIEGADALQKERSAMFANAQKVVEKLQDETDDISIEIEDQEIIFRLNEISHHILLSAIPNSQLENYVRQSLEKFRQKVG